MSLPDMGKPGVWRELFPHALALMASLEEQIYRPWWTFGGGTVLMLRIGHRQRKDIDLFVPDPQHLGYLNPRLSDAAEQITTDYEENAEFIKLFLPAGEIDIVVGTPLTEQPFELVSHAGQEIKVENLCGDHREEDMASRRTRQSPGSLRPVRGGRCRAGGH